MKLEPKALEAAARAMCADPDYCVMGSASTNPPRYECYRYAWQDKLPTAQAAINAYLATASAEAICWLPTKTIEWLETYDGPACGTQTIAHNRPIKTDGGVPLYLAPRAPEASPAVTDEMVKAVARAWASIDGKLQQFELEEANPNLAYDDPDYTGTYQGYLVEAQELIKRAKGNLTATLRQHGKEPSDAR